MEIIKETAKTRKTNTQNLLVIGLYSLFLNYYKIFQVSKKCKFNMKNKKIIKNYL